MSISKTLLKIIAESTKSKWHERKMKDRDRIKKFTSPAIKNFLKAEKKRAEAAETAKTRHSKDRHNKDRYDKEYSPSKPSFRHGKEYLPTSSVAPYRKVASVSPMQQQPPVRKSSSQSVQHVQTPPVQIQTSQSVQQVQIPPVQKVEPPPIQQFQPLVELAPEPTPAPAPAPAPAPEPAPASVEPVPPSAAIPQKMPKPVLSFSVISEISILPVQPSSPQQFPR